MIGWTLTASRFDVDRRDRAPRVLIVDDDRDIRNVLGAILEAAGYETAEAANGIDALDRVRTLLPDVVLLDLTMPRMGGMEVVHRMKSDPATAGIPIVIVSASGDADLAQEAVAAGAHSYIFKPWDEKQIEATVAAALDGRRPA